ncbi:hypothetical protein VTN96DRAFT_7490 [Rasamsonia emersonii]
MADESNFHLDLLHDERLDEMHHQGFVILTLPEPSQGTAKAIESAEKTIEDSVGRQINETKTGEEPTRHFEGAFQSPLSIATVAFTELNINKEYLCEAFLGIDKDSVRHEVGRVVRSVKTNDEYKSRPYMVGPRGHGFAEAILLIRPFRKGLSPEGGFFWAYEGSHTLSPLEFERRRQEGSLKLVPLSVELGQVLVLFSTLWVEFPESHRDVSDTFVCRGYKHQITKPVIDPNLPGYVSDDDVLPFMRLARR